ncbi:MAG: hypothetical protein HYR85_15890 [Planctomycetes bacterium]|nr:hypothetical protein [Planctomycetota bacterium]MBI3848609.1 hypothetical protein [Planctomycetota bacterium]
MHRTSVKSASLVACLLFAVATMASAQAPNVRSAPSRPTAGPADGLWRTTGGKVTLLLDPGALHDLGIDLFTTNQTAVSDMLPQVESTFAVDTKLDAGVVFGTRNGHVNAIAGGSLPTDGEMLLVLENGDTYPIGDFDFHVTPDARGGAYGTITDRRGTDREAFAFSSGLVQFDATTGRFEWSGIELTITNDWAHEIGVPQAGGVLIGNVVVEAIAKATPNASSGTPPLPPGEGDESDTYGLPGPDVIVGDIQEVQRWGSAGGITAYSIGTTSCNVGTVWLNWDSNTNQHPVIGGNLYRLMNGRFEQIGQSWLKHGFYALSLNLCYTDCQPTNGAHLGVHCSDPYSASLNGTQSNLGPKNQVNPSTGFFVYPPANPATPATIGRRLQVHNTDLDPALNPGATYFIEGQYVTPDDAAANNNNNNASYRRVTVSGTPGSGNYSLALAGSTQRQRSSVQAWKDVDPAVTLKTIDVPNDGRYILGYKITDNGNGTWHYEYALYNMNSDRAGQAFSLGLGNGVNVTNLGFHDVDYHSNDGVANTTYDGTDWNPTVVTGAVAWATSTQAQNPNANALRWGTTYTYRFDADTAPTSGSARVDFFKPGSPGYVLIGGVMGPGGPSLPAVILTLNVNTPSAARGAQFSADVVLTNTTSTAWEGQVWDIVTKPNMNLYRNGNPVGVTPVSLQALEQRTISYTYTVPLQMPLGTWQIDARIGPNFSSVTSSQVQQAIVTP